MSEERRPRFRRGMKAIVAFYNAHSDEPIDEKQGYKMVARGTLTVGRDGAKIIAEESQLLADLLRVANAS